MVTEENLADPDTSIDAAMDYALPHDGNPEIFRQTQSCILAYIGWLLDEVRARYPSWAENELQRAMTRLVEVQTAADRAPETPLIRAAYHWAPGDHARRTVNTVRRVLSSRGHACSTSDSGTALAAILKPAGTVARSSPPIAWTKRSSGNAADAAAHQLRSPRSAAPRSAA